MRLQELLKLATLLYSASRVEEDDAKEDDGRASGVGDDDAEAPLISQVHAGTKVSYAILNTRWWPRRGAFSLSS